MSKEAVQWAAEQNLNTITEKCVLHCLAWYSRPDGTSSRPLVATIVQFTGASTRTVQYTLAELERRGVILRGDQREVRHFRADRRPVVYDVPCGAKRECSPDDFEPDDGVVPVIPSTKRVRDTVGARGATDGEDDRVTRTNGVQLTESGVQLTESAPYIGVALNRPTYPTASGCPNNDQPTGPLQVSPVTTRTPRKRVGGTGEAPPGTPRSRGTARRTASAEESPSDGARLIGAPAGSSGSPGTRRVTGARKSKPSPDSGLGLAQEFRALAEAARLVGNSQDLNDPGLATHLTKWMGVGNNPDTPNGIRTMMKEFFTNPDKYYGDVLWTKFVNAAKKLRVAQHKAQPVDYKEAWKRRQRSLEERAAAGDQRAVNVLAEERARKSK